MDISMFDFTQFVVNILFKMASEVKIAPVQTFQEQIIYYYTIVVKHIFNPIVMFTIGCFQHIKKFLKSGKFKKKLLNIL